MKLGLLGGVNIMAQIDSAYQRNILEHNKQTGEADIVPKALWMYQCNLEEQSFVHLAACFVAVICFSCAFCFILYATRVSQA